MTRLGLLLGLFVVGVGCGDNTHYLPADAKLGDSGGMMIDAPGIDAPAPCVAATTHPAVDTITSGDLTLDATQNDNTIAMSVPLDRSVLFVSMREIESSPAFGAVNCGLTLTQLDCKRTSAGTDVPSSNGVVTIHWAVATFTTGVSVQRGAVDTNVANPTDVTLSPSVDPTKSFVIMTGIIGGGTGWGNNEFTHARLVDGATLEIKHAVAGATTSWQVVTMDGASVQRGSAALATNTLTQTVNLPSRIPGGALVLTTYTTDNPSSFAAGSLMLQATLATPQSIALKRELPGVALDVAWEAVELPVLAREVTTTFATGETTKMESVAGIAATSTVALATNEAVLGESSGSTTYAGSDTDLLGEAAATLSVGAGSVTVQRESAQGPGALTWTAVDFSRDRCTGM